MSVCAVNCPTCRQPVEPGPGAAEMADWLYRMQYGRPYEPAVVLSSDTRVGLPRDSERRP